jgi:large subunit ribosomal protein L10
MDTMPSQQILQEKVDEIEEIMKLVSQYKVLGIANLQKVRANMLQEFKKNLADKVYMRVLKNTLVKRAIDKCQDRPELKKLDEHLQGSNLFLFTDLNPFKLAITLKKGKVKTTAKARDIAAFDIVVPAGNTGQSPGPIISQLNSVGLPTRIESGSVWINKDTLVARKGDIIDERLASVLSKLGIKAVESGLAMHVAFTEGLVITQGQLTIDVEKTRKDLEGFHAEAFALSLSIAYPTKENMTVLLQLAHQKAYALSINASVPTKETIADLVRKAHAEMLSLSSRLSTKEEKASSAEKTEKS